jgi:phosphoenolpyruvate carboxykinase (GTP)
VPRANDLDTRGLNLTAAQLGEALRVDAGEWLGALEDLDAFYAQFGGRMPSGIAERLATTQRKFRS